MKTMLSTVVAATIFVVAGLSAPSGLFAQPPRGAVATGKASNYYPLAVGTKWHYQIDTGNGQQILLTGQIGGVDDFKGRELARLDFYSNGQKLPATEHLESNASGVFRSRMNGAEVSPPLCLIKYPLKPGQTWESEMSTGTGPRAKVAGRQLAPEDITVPAGTFKAAIPCKIVVTSGDTTFTNTFWFAEGVGIVKQKSEIEKQTVLMELTKFEPPK